MARLTAWPTWPRVIGSCVVNVLGNLVLTGTSIAPVLFVYAIVAAFEGEYLPSGIIVSVGAFLIALGVVLLVYVKGHLERLDLSFSTVEVVDRESVGLLVLYLLPLLRTSFSDLDFLVLIPAVAIFLALGLTGYSYHFNPVLNLFKWHFYKVGTPEGVTYLLITRKHLRSAIDTIKVGQLTAYTVIDLER